MDELALDLEAATLTPQKQLVRVFYMHWLSLKKDAIAAVKPAAQSCA